MKFNGDHSQFVRKFGVDPETAPVQPPAGGGGITIGGGAADVNIHLACPHCGKQIF